METIRIIRRTEYSGQIREEEICIESNRLYPPGIAAPIPLAPQLDPTAPSEAVAYHMASKHTKVFADGTRALGTDERTDHIAVIEHTTGLMWLVKSMGNPDDVDEGLSQEACAKRCSGLQVLGFEDWRLPTRDELAPLVDVSRRNPAIDTNLFPRFLPRWHWTSTPLMGTDGKASASDAWGVYFDDGYVGNLLRASHGFALAVRRVGQ